MPHNSPEIASFCPSSRTEWREWLAKYHRSAGAVWLVYFKQHTGKPTVSYAEAVEEALCFGWIDSKLVPINDQQYRQYFSVRKPTSVWSRVNKARIERLAAAGLITAAGNESIAIAKQNGSWYSLDDVENLVIPPDLAAAFATHPPASTYFAAWSRTAQRNILQWIAAAKRPATRQKRIHETATLAAQNQKPKPF